MGEDEIQQKIRRVESEFAHFRQSMNEWVIFLNDYNKETREMIYAIEKRLVKLELDSQLKL